MISDHETLIRILEMHARNGLQGTRLQSEAGATFNWMRVFLANANEDERPGRNGQAKKPRPRSQNATPAD